MAKNNNVVLLLIAAVALIGIVQLKLETPSGFATVSCDFNGWPQKVVVDGQTFACGNGRGYCNNEKAV